MWRLSASNSQFEQGSYAYVQQTTPTTLYVIIRCVILCVRKVLPLGVLLLEG
jgi:hypothetical protein